MDVTQNHEHGILQGPSEPPRAGVSVRVCTSVCALVEGDAVGGCGV